MIINVNRLKWPFLLLTIITIATTASFRYTTYVIGDIQPNYLNVISECQAPPGKAMEMKKNYALQLPHQHVYYLKTHKTGSSTMYHIFSEYARSHGLVPLLPRSYHINQGEGFHEHQLLMVNKIKKFDMVFSHHTYTPSIFKYLHNDTFKVTSLREPFNNFVSAFLYYRNEFSVAYLKRVPTDDPVLEFLRHPDKYEVKGHGSWTNNRQSIDMGYEVSKGFNNTKYIKEFIKESERRFHLVIIMEYFDESLVILKRTLRWKTEDILYILKNQGSYYKKHGSPKNTSLEEEKRKLHAKFSKPDIMLYNYFLNHFKDKMEQEVGLKEEVDEFRDILTRVRRHCSNSSEIENMNNMVISPGKWNNGFQITPTKCKALAFGFFKVTDFLKQNQRAMFIK